MENKEFENMNNTEHTEGTGLEAIFSSTQKEAESKETQQSAPQTNYDNQPAPSQSYYTQQTYNTQPAQNYAQTAHPVQNYQSSYSQSTQPVQNYQNSYSQSGQNYYQPYNRQQQYTDPYRQQMNNDYYSRNYGDKYNEASSVTSGTPAVSAKPKKKKSGSGKKAALFAAMIALSLCVGLGGGLAGAYLMGQNNNSSVVKSDTSKSDGSTTESSVSKDGSLVITQASDTETAPTNTTEVVAKVKDSVVEITTESTSYDYFYGQYISQGAGSGVIISKDGYIITNNHVIEDATTVKVRLTNGQTYDAKVIGSDSLVDIALLKIEANDLTTATFGDSAKLSVGQTSIVIGNPLGRLGGTVTDGIISALDREIQIDGKTMNLLQTNAAINPGNSGGGMFDSNGNLIGIVVAKSAYSSSGTSAEGLGYAIPINDVISILDDLKTDGYVKDRAYLGINLQDITSENDMLLYRVDRAGTYVSSVGVGTSAEKAGLKISDCIIKIDDKEITQSSEVSAIIAKHKKGDVVKITVYRDGKEIELEATLDARPDGNNSGSQNVTPKRYNSPSSSDFDYFDEDSNY